MIYCVFIILAVVAVEAAAALGLLIRRLAREEKEDGGDAAPSGTPPTAEEPGASDFEERWREGLDAMMGYDLGAARRAVRRDEDEK